ncbi:hypothetical protein Lfu02_39370 [Longispora fulva]|uniref:Putative heavy-metal chelation domain-containing protein n=1 Tax=Longispora fulva TaxID=619741 RepID=A0A8J7KWC9_9ACTN|nr:DUF364 domain-containing protein [Longispora fulva]MBG6136397.1 hypothetical protein [Longispora fulva]GIG59565.1 hypothetical protein Lfu02_39370 [Longispora fulva]
MRSVDELIAHTLQGDGLDTPVTVAFSTRQGAHHQGRHTGYRNEVVCVRVGAAVGACSVEPGELPEEDVFSHLGRPVRDLLTHPVRAVRVAALDAYLMDRRPFGSDQHAVARVLAAGDSLAKSTARARAVVDLLPGDVSGPVAVVGVVNSLLHALRARGMGYLACDFKGGFTEWGEPVHTRAALDGAGALLVSGMTLGNGTFEPLLAHARDAGIPFVVFAQTGSAVAREFLGSGVTALSAEPYPFFWLDGGPSTLHHYTAKGRP